MGCKKEDTKGPFISISDIKKYPIPFQYIAVKTLSQTSDSSLVFALCCSDNTLQIIKFNKDLDPILDVNINEDVGGLGEIIENADKDYLIVCTPSERSNNRWLKLLKISSGGQLVWVKEYLKSDYDYQANYGSTIKQLIDGNYFLTVKIEEDSLLLLRINDNGQSLGGRIYPVIDAIYGIASASSYLNQDHDFIYSTGQQIIEFSPSGEILWETPYSSSDFYNYLHLHDSSNFFVTGFNLYLKDKYYSHRVLLRRYSISGSLIWSTTFDTDINGSGNSIYSQAPNNLYLFGDGSTVTKADFSGNLIFSEPIPGIVSPSIGYYITKKNSNFLAFGIEGYRAKDASSIYLVKFNEIN